MSTNLIYFPINNVFCSARGARSAGCSPSARDTRERRDVHSSLGSAAAAAVVITAATVVAAGE